MLIVVEQMKIKKNGDCIFEDKLEGAVSVCVMALIRKNNKLLGDTTTLQKKMSAVK